MKLEQSTDQKLSDDEAKQLADFMKETLGDRANEVRAGQRLVGSPDAQPEDRLSAIVYSSAIPPAPAQRKSFPPPSTPAATVDFP